MANAYQLPDWELLLKAVVASPDDDLPRLVAADWLDEHGEPERAEFVRVQVERAKADRPELEWREKALWNNPVFGGTWAAEECPVIATLDFGSSLRTAAVSGAERVTFRRGFPFRVSCTAEEWLRYGGRIVPRQPVRELALTGCDRLDPTDWWQMTDTLRPLTKLEIDTLSPLLGTFLRDYICPGVEVIGPDGPVMDEIIAARTPTPTRRPVEPPRLSGPEDLPGRSDIPF